jgi:cytochrome c-type biogenesis protein CcmH/NrfG
LTDFLLQPQAQAWLLFVAVVCLIVIAVTTVVGVGIIMVAAQAMNQRATLTEKLQPLLDQGELDTVVLHSRERLQTFPDDAVAHYFLGVALHRRGENRQALVHLRRVPELQAGWDIGPMIKAIEEKLSSTESGPELKIVKHPSATSPSDA